MAYLVNIENTGLSSDAQVRRLAEILQAAGHDVRFTRDLGLVNPSSSCPCSDAEWEDALIAASEPETGTYYVEMGDVAGEYIATSEAGALDAIARDAGYASWAEAESQGLASGALVIKIDTAAICKAAPSVVFQDPYGDGIAVMGGKSYATWQELARSFGRNCWDFKA